MASSVFLIINNSEIVAVKELNEVLTSFPRMRNRHVVIMFLKGIKRINILFIAGLYLLYRDRGLTFNLSGSVGDRADLFINENDSFELKYNLAHIEHLYGSISSRWLNSVSVSEVDVKASRVYAPILLINNETINNLFKNCVDARLNDLKSRYIQSLNQESNQVEKIYFTEIPDDHIINRLYSNAPIYTFVYCILHSIDNPFNECNNDLSVAISRIDRIWTFTNRYVGGLYELAKNIVGHSSNKQGVITVRAYKNEKDTDSDRIIETYVIDYGELGIIPTMIREIDVEFSSDRDLPGPEDFVDRSLLMDNYSLQKFFSPGKAYRLSRQFRREMAHLGLLHFMSLIRSYNGSSWISTGGHRNNGRDVYGDKGLENEQLIIGTNFHFSLPMSRHFSDESKTDVAPASTTREAITAMPHVYSLLDQISIVRLKNEFYDKGELISIDNREAEGRLLDSIHFDKIRSKYIALDFEGLSFSATSLLRVLALVSESTDKNVIVMNIATDILSEMIENNRTYFKTMDEVDSVPFWIQERSILIYSKIDVGGHDFYFADILYGKNLESFISVNKVISNSFPNYVTIASDDDVALADEYFREPPVSDFFFESTLLPFDVVLQDASNGDLFSYNLMALVNKKLL